MKAASTGETGKEPPEDSQASPQPDGASTELESETENDEQLIAAYDNRPSEYEGSCLRPLGLCELGGCCDLCWYGPEHPRHQKKH